MSSVEQYSLRRSHKVRFISYLYKYIKQVNMVEGSHLQGHACWHVELMKSMSFHLISSYRMNGERRGLKVLSVMVH